MTVIEMNTDRSRKTRHEVLPREPGQSHIDFPSPLLREKDFDEAADQIHMR
ncbi:MAG: hypothetical protein JWM33_3326 [Caulobacteraceae bacterium]|nr:hypothetical protein [Caulobacteraceae bacterium]